MATVFRLVVSTILVMLAVNQSLAQDCIAKISDVLSITSCPRLEIRNYQLCDTCTQFAKCVFGRPFLQECPKGTFFDAKNIHFCQKSSSTCSACGPLPHVAYGKFTLNPINFILAALKCDAGFLPKIPNYEIECKQGASDWGVKTEDLCISESDLECPQVPNVNNGGFELIGEYYSTAKLTCNEGFEPKPGYRNFTIVCEGTQWPVLSSYDLCEEGCIKHCSGKANGNYEFCEDCTAFIACSGGMTYTMQCPGGQEWDDNDKKCVAKSTTCGDGPCEEPPRVKNGKFIPKATRPTDAILECDDGFMAAIPNYIVSCNGTAWTKVPDNICTTELTSTEQGTRFVVAFFKNFNGRGNLGLIVFSQRDTQIRVIASEQSTYNKTININAETPLRITDIPQSFQNTLPSTVSKNVIFIEADDDVTVYAFNGMYGSSDAALVLPEVALGKDYIISAGPENLAIAVVGVKDDTDVYVTYTTGEKVSHSISRGELFYLHKPGKFSATGTRVSSNKPVAIFSGNECTKVPFEFAACDTLYEQLLPVTSLQFVYVTSCFLPRRIYRLEVVTVMDDTLVTIKANESSITYTKHEGQNITIDYFDCETVSVSSSKPILVSQFGLGGYIDNRTSGGQTIGDPSMVYLPAVTSYNNKYFFASFGPPIGPNYKNQTVMITILSTHRNGLLLNNIAVDASRNMATIDVPDHGEFTVVYVEKTKADVDILTHSSNKPFGAIQYGTAVFTEYALPLGTKLKSNENQNDLTP